MKFVSLDTETTGTDTDNDLIIEFAMIGVDTEKPRSEWPVYHKIVAHDRYEGGAYAINLNARIFEVLKRYHNKEQVTDYEVIHVDNLGADVFEFLIGKCGYQLNGRGTVTIYVAGKNPHGFDIPMCKNWHHKLDEYVTFGHRSFDPAILFWDHENDLVPPGLEKCKERAGLGDIVTHNAKEDAFDVIDLIFKGKGIQEL